MTFYNVRSSFCGSVLSDVTFTTVDLKSLSCGSGSSRQSVSASVAAPTLAVSAVGVLGLRAVRRRRLRSAAGGAAARSRSTFSSKVEDTAGSEMQRDRVNAVGHARTWDFHT